MKKRTTFFNSFIKRIKSIKFKDVLGIFGIACLMCLGLYFGSIIYGILGAGFGLALGYVCGKLIIAY